MSETPSETAPDHEVPEAGDATPAASTAAPAPPPRRADGRSAIAWLAALLVLAIGGVLSSPLWAPALEPVLPWGRAPAASAAETAALAARLEALEGRMRSLDAALPAIRSGVAAAAQRLDRLEQGATADRRLEPAVAAAASAVERLGRRVDAADAQQTGTADTVQRAQQALAGLDKRVGDFGDRLGALEKRVPPGNAAGQNNAALLLSLMQLRQAVAAGRSFAPELGAFEALAHSQSDLAAAAAPLAGNAANGVADRTALRRQLAELAARPSEAAAPPAAQSWWQQALDRLRGLVRVRRIGAPPNAAAVAVDKAQSALAAGDLPAAVAVLERLAGTDSASARPWLAAAHARLDAEAALDRLQTLLTARLAAKPGAPS